MEGGEPNRIKMEGPVVVPGTPLFQRPLSSLKVSISTQPGPEDKEEKEEEEHKEKKMMVKMEGGPSLHANLSLKRPFNIVQPGNEDHSNDDDHDDDDDDDDDKEEKGYQVGRERNPTKISV